MFRTAGSTVEGLHEISPAAPEIKSDDRALPRV